MCLCVCLFVCLLCVCVFWCLFVCYVFVCCYLIVSCSWLPVCGLFSHYLFVFFICVFYVFRSMCVSFVVIYFGIILMVYLLRSFSHSKLSLYIDNVCVCVCVGARARAYMRGRVYMCVRYTPSIINVIENTSNCTLTSIVLVRI